MVQKVLLIDTTTGYYKIQRFRVGDFFGEVDLGPVDVVRIWKNGRGGLYALIDFVYERFIDHYEINPRILAVGPAAQATDFGGIASVPIIDGKLTSIDTWAGRGGLGSRMLQEHGIAAIVYGGTVIDEDFRSCLSTTTVST